MEVLASSRSCNLNGMLENLWQALTDFAQGSLPQDDLTILGFQYRGPAEPDDISLD